MKLEEGRLMFLVTWNQSNTFPCSYKATLCPPMMHYYMLWSRPTWHHTTWQWRVAFTPCQQPTKKIETVHARMAPCHWLLNNSPSIILVRPATEEAMSDKWTQSNPP